MYSQEEKERYITNISSLAKKYKMPFNVCAALNGNEASISLLHDIVTTGVASDIESEQSFLVKHYTKHININGETGEKIDAGVPYDYEQECLASPKRCRYALKKILFGLTKSCEAFEILELEHLPQGKLDTIAQFVINEIGNQYNYFSLKAIVELIDGSKMKELSKGVAHLTPSQKIVRIGQGMRFLKATSLVVPFGVTKIEPYAFEGVPLTTVQLSDSISYLGYGAFKDCPIKKILLPKNKYMTVLYDIGLDFNAIDMILLPETIKEIKINRFNSALIESKVRHGHVIKINGTTYQPNIS